MSILHILLEIGALFIHNGSSNTPHPIGTSGRHLRAYFNSDYLGVSPKHVRCICAELKELFERTAQEKKMLDMYGQPIDLAKPRMRVWAPEKAAVVLGYELARQLDVPFGIIEKKSTGNLCLDRFSPRANEQALIVDNAATTGGTIKQCVSVLGEGGANVLSPALCIIDLGGNKGDNTRKIMALEHIDSPGWKSAESCELCALGSPPIKNPKTNWQLLVHH